MDGGITFAYTESIESDFFHIDFTILLQSLVSLPSEIVMNLKTTGVK